MGSSVIIWDREDCIKEASKKIVVRDVEVHEKISHDSESLISVIHTSLLNSKKKNLKKKIITEIQSCLPSIPFFVLGIFR